MADDPAVERAQFVELLSRHGGNISAIGRAIGWPGPTVRHRLQMHGLNIRNWAGKLIPSEEEKLRQKLGQRRKYREIGAFKTRLPTAPGIESISMAIRKMEGGRQRFLELVQMAMLNGSEQATRWWTIFTDLSRHEQGRASLDDITLAAGVTPKDIMAVVVSTAMECGVDAANLIAALDHPNIVRQAVKSAKRIGGEYADVAQKDRTMLFQHMGFIPTPRGAQVTVHANASASAQAAAVAAEEPSMPGFADRMLSLKDAKDRVQRRIIDSSASKVE